MRRWRNGAAAVVAMLALATVSCAGGGQSVVGSGSGAAGSSDGTARVLGASETPGSQATAPPDPPMRHDLLKVAEVRPFTALGYDIREVPLVDPGKWDVTVLRGPCGAALTTPFTPGQDTKIFFSTVALMVETTAPWDDRAAAFYDAARKDFNIGCAGFDDPSAFGARVVLTSLVDLDGFAGEDIGWTQTIAGAERTGLRQVSLAHDGDRLLMLAVVTSPPAPPDNFEKLATVALTTS